MDQELAKVFVENKDLLMVFDKKSLYPSAMVDDESYYARFEAGYIFTADKEKYFYHQIFHKTFTQFKNQASAILWVRYYNLKNSKLQHLPVIRDVILHGKKC